MAKRTIVSMPGDGIGNVVLPEAIRVLDAVGFEAKYVHADIGWEFWCNEGNALPERTVELLAEHKIGLFGAITSKPKDKAAAELKPALRDKGYVYYSPIVGLRQRFNLDICIRPCRSFTGNPLNFIRKGPGGSVDEPLVNAVIFRQNTEGLYGGVEWTDPPEQVRAALATHHEVRPVRQNARTRPGRLDPHLHPRSLPPHRPRRLRIRSQVRLQVRHHLRKTQRHPRNLRHAHRRGQTGRTRLPRHRRSGRPTSTPR